MSKNERYTEFVNISYEKVCQILKGHDSNIFVESIHPINSARANSNYMIEMSNGKLLLRVCRSMNTYDHEIIIDRVLDVFERKYNSVSTHKLQKNWYELAILRDLVNLLQLISSEKELPEYHGILRNHIYDTLCYFEAL